MRQAKLIAALAVLLAVLVVPAFESDAELSVTDIGSDAKFDTFNGGSIRFEVMNTSDSDCTIDVEVKNGNKTVGSAKGYPVKADGTTEVVVDMKGFTTAGSYNLDVYCTSNDQGNRFDVSGHFTVHVVVEKNVLSNWTTYVVIIVAIIAVAIIIFIKVRETPKKKTEMTFEQLEEERKAKMAKKSSKNDGPAPSTERKRYLSEKNKKE